MFKRRAPLTKLQHLRELLWPSMGWRRAFRYGWLRIARLSDSARSIAFALSLGVAVSFSPLVGTHFVQAGLLAYFFRVNIMVALIANCIGNPWTFPFIWWASIVFGSYLVGIFGVSTLMTLPPDLNFSVLWHIITHEPLRIFLPWMIGGHVLGLLSIPVTYPVFYRMVKAGHLARRQAKLYNIHRVAREVTQEHMVKP